MSASPPGPTATALSAARAARRAGDAAGAARLYAAHLARRPQDLPARLEQAQALWAAGDRPAAVAAWEAARAIDPRAAEPRLRLANAARLAGRAQEAAALVGAVLADHPGHAGALADQAALLLAAGDAAGAEAALRAAVAAEPGRWQAWMDLGRLLARRGALPGAFAAFAAARAIPPARPEPFVEAARLMLVAGDAPGALALLEEGRAALPDAADLRIAAAEALRVLGRRREALALIAPLPQAAPLAAVDRAVLDRPARLGSDAPAGPDEAGATLAEALAGATPREIERALTTATRDAHPFTAIGAARALLARRSDPEGRLVAGLAEVGAFGLLTMARSAGERIDILAAEAAGLPRKVAARLASRRVTAALALGDWPGALAAAESGLALGEREFEAVVAMLRALPGEPSPEECLALLAPGRAPARLRPWLADRAGPVVPHDDPRLALGWDMRGLEMVLRRNVALARGEGAAARALFARLFEPQGIACPQPEGAPEGIAHLGCPPEAPVDGPLVSIIIGAWQAEDTLAVALRSVLAQSWRNIEVLVVDDASTDGTARVIEAFAARDPRVRPLAQARNAGVYAARNLALGQARGDFVTVHDADDWMHPRRIETEVAAFADPRVQAVESRWVRIDESGRAPFLPYGMPVYANPALMMYRAAALRRLGVFDPVRFSADQEMAWRLKLAYGLDALVSLQKILTVGMAREGSLTTASWSGMDRFGFSAPRLAYREAWGAWHMDCDARGALPHRAPGEVPPYAAALPAGMLDAG